MKYVPTLSRYLLLIAGTRIASGGVLPPEIAQAMAADPILVEMITGVLMDAAAVLWFVRSKARKAIASI